MRGRERKKIEFRASFVLSCKQSSKAKKKKERERERNQVEKS